MTLNLGSCHYLLNKIIQLRAQGFFCSCGIPIKLNQICWKTHGRYTVNIPGISQSKPFHLFSLRERETTQSTYRLTTAGAVWSQTEVLSSPVSSK